MVKSENYQYRSGGRILELRMTTSGRYAYYVDAHYVGPFDSLERAFETLHATATWPVDKFIPPRSPSDWLRIKGELERDK